MVVCALLGSAVLGWSRAAAAQEGGELTDEEARSLYQAGAIAFDQGRFENALEHFQRAYALSKRPQLLFNIGVVQDRLRHDEQALQAFEQYMQQVPDGAEAAHVRARIAVLRKTLAERAAAGQAPPGDGAPASTTPQQLEPDAAQAAPAPQQATPAPSAEIVKSRTARIPAKRSTLVPWLLVGAGAAVAVTGGVLLAVGQARRGKIEDAAVGTAWDDVAQYDDADTFTGVGAALLGVGVAGAVVGVVLLSVGGEDEHPSASLRLGPTGVSVRGAL